MEIESKGATWAGITWARCFTCSGFESRETFLVTCATRWIKHTRDFLPTEFRQKQCCKGCRPFDALLGREAPQRTLRKLTLKRWVVAALELARWLDHGNHDCHTAGEYAKADYVRNIKEACSQNGPADATDEFYAVEDAHLARVREGVTLLIICNWCRQPTRPSLWTQVLHYRLLNIRCPHCTAYQLPETSTLVMIMTDAVSGVFFEYRCVWPGLADWNRGTKLPDFMQDGWLTEMALKAVDTRSAVDKSSVTNLKEFVMQSVINLSDFMLHQALPNPIMMHDCGPVNGPFDQWAELVRLLANVLSGARDLGRLLGSLADFADFESSVP